MWSHDSYYVPSKAVWPVVVVAGTTSVLAGLANLINGLSDGKLMLYAGSVLIVVGLTAWFRDQSIESETGKYNKQVDVSYRMGMAWFIFSEVMFFAAFFGALFYTRYLAVPWLAGEGGGPGLFTFDFLWDAVATAKDYTASWPTNGPGKVGGHFEKMEALGLPLANTIILLTSGYTITMAHHALIDDRRKQLKLWMIATISLGVLFLICQGYEYHHAYTEMGLTLGAGIYGSTFFMLTGFHGLHVTLGTFMLCMILLRIYRGHFSPDNHFAFEGVAWYWHFVDVVWLLLFVIVYWM